MTDEERLLKIEDLIIKYSWIDGAHHKDWLIDQIMRVITGIDYQDWVKSYCNGDDGPFTYEWNTGIAP